MRRLAGIAAIVALVFGLAACSPSAPDAETITLPENAVIIDVRTPGEYGKGHLSGALLLDLNAGEVAAAVDTLDPEADYFVYCRSGNRSGQAQQLMQQAGIENVTNLGSLQEAAQATGLQIVKE